MLIAGFFLISFIFAGVDNIPYWAYDGGYVGVRNISMGASGAAEKGEVDSCFYNFSGASGLKDKLWSLTYRILRTPDNEFYPSTKKLYGIGLFTDRGGFIYKTLSSYSMEISSVTEEIKVNKYTLFFSIPQGENVIFSMGFNYYSGRWAEAPSDNLIQDGNGLGLDIGLIYRASPNINYGFSVKNLLGRMGWEEKTEKIPIFIINSVNVKLSEFVSFNFDVESRKYYKDTVEGRNLTIKHFGIEHNILNTVFLRAGFYGEQPGEKQKTTYTAGIGYKKNKVEISLSWKTFYKNNIKYEEVLAGINAPLQ